MPKLVSKEEVLRVLRRTGNVDQITEARAVLPDPVDLDRDRPVLEGLGLTRDGLFDDMGGSP